jgi:DDE superfamily endonuclease
LIECAYTEAEAAGLAVWCQDEAGPYQAIPQPGATWHPAGHPALQPHEYIRGGTAKLLTLFRPATGDVRAQGVLSAPNAVLHPWLKDHMLSVLAELDREPLPVRVPLPEGHVLMRTWEHWWWSYERPKPPPALRLILIWDNLKGHLSYDLVRWLLQHGIFPLYTPISGSWLNMAESLQRIIVRRALAGQHPQAPQHIIDWLEQTVPGWNVHPTPFIWDGQRRRRRDRARLRRHALGGSGAAVSDGYSIPT